MIKRAAVLQSTYRLTILPSSAKSAHAANLNYDLLLFKDLWLYQTNGHVCVHNYVSLCAVEVHIGIGCDMMDDYSLRSPMYYQTNRHGREGGLTTR